MNCQFETLLLIFLCVHTHKSSSSHTSCSISQTYFPVLFLKSRKHLIFHIFPSLLMLLHWLDAFPGSPHHCAGSFQTALPGCWDLQSWAQQWRNICRGREHCMAQLLQSDGTTPDLHPETDIICATCVKASVTKRGKLLYGESTWCWGNAQEKIIG